MRPLILLLLSLTLASCRRDLDVPVEMDDAPFDLLLPPGMEPPPIPVDAPMTEASVRLGKALFFEPRLSRTGTISCGSCHIPDHAFSDVVPLSLGVEGRVGMRNAPSLGNVGYHAPFFRDGGVPSLEQQAIAPIHDPVEMDHDIHAAAADLRDVEPYRSLSLKAYGERLTANLLVKALATYERTLISGWSRFDRFMQGDLSALDQAELRGWSLFTSEELNCAACHGGPDFTDNSFHNVGQYLDYTDHGRERITMLPSDLGRFKTPSLRNVALNAPYMHDGTMATLEEVIDHFASGGLPHPNRSPEMRNFALTTGQRADLVAFLNALTDERSLDQVP